MFQSIILTLFAFLATFGGPAPAQAGTAVDAPGGTSYGPPTVPRPRPPAYPVIARTGNQVIALPTGAGTVTGCTAARVSTTAVLACDGTVAGGYAYAMYSFKGRQGYHVHVHATSSSPYRYTVQVSRGWRRVYVQVSVEGAGQATINRITYRHDR